MAVIISDFNVNLNCTSHDSDPLIDFCICNHLFTRTSLLCTFPYHSSHCIFSHLHKLCIRQIFPPITSFFSLRSRSYRDHPWFLRLSPFSSHHHCFRFFVRFDLESFLSSLLFLDWSTIDRSATFDGKIEILNHYLLTTRDAPLWSFRARRSSAPWLDETIRSFMHKRDAARGAFLSYPSSASRDFFCALRNEVSCLIDASKSNYLLQRLSSTNHSSRLWFELRSLGLAKFKSSATISLDCINLYFTSAHSSSSVSLSSPVFLPVSLYVFSSFYHSSSSLSLFDFTFFFS